MGKTSPAVIRWSCLLNIVCRRSRRRRESHQIFRHVPKRLPSSSTLAPRVPSWLLLISLSNLKFLWHLTTRMLGLTRIEPATLEDLPSLAQLLMDLFAQESDFRPDYNLQIRGLRLILEQPSRGRVLVLRSATQI